MNTTNTGMIRRFDDLGRIVIPKEIRKALHICEGDPVAISVTDQVIHLQKYETMKNIASVSEVFLKAFSANCGSCYCVICGTDHIIAYRGPSLSTKQFLSDRVQDYIKRQKLYVSGDPGTYETPDSEPMTLFDDDKYTIEALYPVGTAQKPLGAIILLKYRRATSLEMVSAKLIATLLTEFLLNE